MLINRDTTIQQQEKETTNGLITLFESFDDFRKQWDDHAIKWYQKLIGHREETEKEKERRENGEPVKSNLFIPRTYQIIDTIRARMLMALFKNRPYIEFVPIPSQQVRLSLQQSEDKAEIASALLDEQLNKNDIVAKFYDYLTSMLVFPAGVMGVGWKYEEDYVKRKVPEPEIIQTQYGAQYTGNYVYEVRESIETVWDDNEFVNIDYFDFWPDPKGSNLDDCRGVFQREFATRDDILQRLNFLDRLDEGIIYLQSVQELEKLRGVINLERGRERRLSEVGINDDMPEIFKNSNDERLNKNGEYELLHYWEDNRHAILVNREKCIYDGPSPYWRHRKKPFITSSYDRLPNQFYGMSAVQILNDLQEEENTIHNQRSDNVNFIINKMWKVRRGADIDKSQLVSEPAGVLEVDRMDDVEEFGMKDVAASSFHQQNFISQIMENTLATPPVIRGASSSGDQTATETLKQSNNASLRFDVKIQLFRSLDIKRMAYLADMNNQQFINSNRLVRLGTGQAMQWRNINPGEFIGERDYRPAGANVDPAANKQARREQLTQMMQFLLQSKVPFVNLYKLIEEWLQAFDIKNAEKFILPQEQAKQQMQMMMAAQQQASGEGMPTQAQQTQNAQTGRARGRRPQTTRSPQEQTSGQVR